MSFLLLYDVFTDAFDEHAIRWPVTLETDGQTLKGELIADGTDYLIPRQYELELKWTFRLLKLDDDTVIDFRDDPFPLKWSERRYEERLRKFEASGEEAWLRQFVIDAADASRETLTDGLLRHPAFTQALQEANIATPDVIHLAKEPVYEPGQGD
ncbi:hypothetical protein [Salisediminibacterium selenitireducens]|uniref:Uncharacterized protein n=1 Tax=Bacillus selenitireducens (strain ATCC 700615 / DSM 15326 / MLS10) TaxID=439292 RepID=D6Y0W0_BACIE|nr:hypothetical protein [Salisediminibacterium selenitireducens]ADI00678.1 hypothetical protein Bsel_3196 [[Bacillus] selenitireducens MLS10]